MLHLGNQRVEMERKRDLFYLKIKTFLFLFFFDCIVFKTRKEMEKEIPKKLCIGKPY